MLLCVAKIIHHAEIEYSFATDALDEVSDFVDKLVEISDKKEREDCYIR
jgi:hypothetical protein